MLFTIEKEIKKGDYVYAKVPSHPKATQNGYVLLHRVIMENKLNRLLADNEVVHHKDFNPKNNSEDNLEVLTKDEHNKLHSELHKGRTYLTFICPNCLKEFKKEKRLFHGTRKFGPFCSRHCNGVYSHKVKNTTTTA